VRPKTSKILFSVFFEKKQKEKKKQFHCLEKKLQGIV
jgi:hypothetical protein